MFSLFLLVVGIVIGVLITHLGYAPVVANLKADLIATENRIKALIAKVKI